MNAAMVAMNEIENLAAQIALRFKPERIILFGSHAYGRPTPDSAVDLLVVIPDDGNPLGKAGEIRCALDNRFPLDIIVRDPHDLKRRIQWHDWFLIEVTQKGRILYESAHG